MSTECDIKPQVAKPLPAHEQNRLYAALSDIVTRKLQCLVTERPFKQYVVYKVQLLVASRLCVSMMIKHYTENHFWRYEILRNRLLHILFSGFIGCIFYFFCFSYSILHVMRKMKREYWHSRALVMRCNSENEMSSFTNLVALHPHWYHLCAKPICFSFEITCFLCCGLNL